MENHLADSADDAVNTSSDWSISSLLGFTWPTNGIIDYFTGRPSFGAGVEVGRNGGDAMQVAMANYYGANNYRSEGLSLAGAGTYESLLGYTTTAALPPAIVLTEKSGSHFVLASGRAGFVNSPYWGLAGEALVARLGAGAGTVPVVTNGRSALPDAFAGVKDASAYLKAAGVSRADRVQILQSFEQGTISVETAGDSLYGLRFHDFGDKAKPMGQYLFETFTAQTNRAELALPPEWNGMTGIKQWQIKPGTTLLRGNTAPQLNYGKQYVGGAEQMFVLEPWKYGSLR